ncbi:5'/3'-nucleotidase SurE, partial [Campylobacter coli]|nr:5'/3'-nucleotidase SurE [Campylobacter coli]EDN2773822.1 5'/3'-nucleotidase SurE [Campylobacter coli]
AAANLDFEDEKDSDIALLKKGYVTITPIMLDLSAYDKMKKVKKWLKANNE